MRIALTGICLVLVLLCGDCFCENKDQASSSNQGYNERSDNTSSLNQSFEDLQKDADFHKQQCPKCGGNNTRLTRNGLHCKDCRKTHYISEYGSKLFQKINACIWKSLKDIDPDLPGRTVPNHQKYRNILAFFKYKFDEYTKKQSPKSLRKKRKEFKSNDIRYYVGEYFGYSTRNMGFLFAQIKGTEVKERIKFKITKEDYEKIVPKDIAKEVDTKLTKYKEYRKKKKINSYDSMKNDSESAKIVHYLWEMGFSYLRIVELLGLEEVYKNCCNIPEKPKWSKDTKNKTNEFRMILPNNLELLADVASNQEPIYVGNEKSVDEEATETINNKESADNEVSIYLGKRKRSINDEGSEVLHPKKRKRKISENSSVEQGVHEENQSIGMISDVGSDIEPLVDQKIGENSEEKQPDESQSVIEILSDTESEDESLEEKKKRKEILDDRPPYKKKLRRKIIKNAKR